jgi:hypothetical protein
MSAVAARVSDVRRARAARVLRNGGTWQRAADAAQLESKRTIGRWLKEPDFINLLHARGIMVAGPLRITADDSATLEEVETNESVAWIATAETPAVLGSLVVSDATFLRLVFVAADDVARVQADIGAKRFPLVPEARRATLVQSALTALADPGELLTVTRLFTADQRESFATWLSLWKFRAGESRDVRTLGELWEGQALLADALCEHPHTFLLKARKLGATELSLAFAGYCARVRDVNARIALYSYRERAALDLLAKVRFGLDNLPPHLRLPFLKEPTLKSLEYDAGHEDVRTVVSYPTSQNTSIETTSTHALCDEFAHWPHGERTFAALEPTFTAPRATSQLLTTGRGPADWSATYWRACKDGDGLHGPVFIPATARPDRDPAWLAAKRRTMTKQAFRTEYALDESDALAGADGFFFAQETIDRMAQDVLPGAAMLLHAERRNKECLLNGKTSIFRDYRLITGVDIGVRDATVLVTLMIVGDMKIVVAFERHTGLSYPAIQNVIEQKARDFPNAPIAIEQNAMGITVIQNLNLPAHRIIPFTTSALSKARALEGIQYALEQGLLKAHPDECAQLFTELRNYQIPDEHVQQDSVMALAIACDCAPQVYAQGRVMAVIQF